jgi:hypothetical protein
VGTGVSLSLATAAHIVDGSDVVGGAKIAETAYGDVGESARAQD